MKTPKEKVIIPRKPAASKKSAVITIRLTERQKAALVEKAAAAELTITDYLMRRIG